jgi:hypothetical protein
VLPGDFILPSEASVQTQALAVKLESLDLFAAVDSVHTTPTKNISTDLTEITETAGIQSYSAVMRFSVDGDGEESKEIHLELRRDVHFVTAFPCVSSHHTEMLKSPKSPSAHSPPHSPSDNPRDFTGTWEHCHICPIYPQYLISFRSSIAQGLYLRQSISLVPSNRPETPVIRFAPLLSSLTHNWRTRPCTL